MIEIKNLNFSYGELKVFDNLSLTLRESCTVLEGVSGRGKTTLLRILAGLLRPQSGSVTGVPPRPAMMFQEDRLLPWLTVRENVKAAGDVGNLLKLVELEDYSEAYPDSLSGGQRRRTALARALSFGGGILLLDEPLKGLDEALMSRLVPKIKAFNIPIIVTSHSAFETSLWGGERVVI